MVGMETSLNEIVGLTLVVLGLAGFGVALAGMLGFLPPPRWGARSNRARGDRS
jgi:hypothetical protein